MTEVVSSCHFWVQLVEQGKLHSIKQCCIACSVVMVCFGVGGLDQKAHFALCIGMAIGKMYGL